MMRSPDLRLGDIRTTLHRDPTPFRRMIDHPGRDILMFARSGDFELEVGGAAPVAIPEGTAVGFDGSIRAWCRSAPAGDAGEVELFVSSIPRRLSLLQHRPGGTIVVPPDAYPHATILRHTVEAQICEHLHPSSNASESVIRRCVEICRIQLVRYQRFSAIRQLDAPAALAADENLLRAWSAYFAEPGRRWTLQALADAAGLSRTTFATRFRQVFGAPPLPMLATLRLEQAETMPRTSTAPLTEIAFTVGYNAEAAFVRAFHRQYGVPPGRFRAERTAQRSAR